MDKLLFTIAIPAYNNEKSIQKTIDSCLNQKTDIPYEILIVDDASTDTTPEILKSYHDPKIRVVTLDERIPLIQNHNMCFKHALGDYVVFCHADDMLENHAIAFFHNKLKERLFPEKYIVWGNSMFRDFSERAIRLAGFSYNTIVVGKYAPLMFMHGGLTPSGTLYSRQSFIDKGGFLKTDMNSSPSDMTTMIHLAMQGFRFEMVDEMLFYREGSTTALSNSNIDVYLNELDDAFKYFIEQVPASELKKLITLASTQKQKPIYFFYAMAQSAEFRPQIKKIIIRNLLKYPLRLRNPVIRKILKRVF
jgi:glycosyltransferase involved in cell wall biosynthesis